MEWYDFLFQIEAEGVGEIFCLSQSLTLYLAGKEKGYVLGNFVSRKVHLMKYNFLSVTEIILL